MEGVKLSTEESERRLREIERQEKGPTYEEVMRRFILMHVANMAQSPVLYLSYYEGVEM